MIIGYAATCGLVMSSPSRQRLGLEVRREKILREVGYRVRGGACRFRERNLVILDAKWLPRTKVEILPKLCAAGDIDGCICRQRRAVVETTRCRVEYTGPSRARNRHPTRAS